jgi:hypothetical protein
MILHNFGNADVSMLNAKWANWKCFRFWVCEFYIVLQKFIQFSNCIWISLQWRWQIRCSAFKAVHRNCVVVCIFIQLSVNNAFDYNFADFGEFIIESIFFGSTENDDKKEKLDKENRLRGIISERYCVGDSDLQRIIDEKDKIIRKL